MGNLTGLFIIFGFEGSLTNQLAFTAKPGVFLPIISRRAAKIMAKIFAMVRIAIAVE